VHALVMAQRQIAAAPRPHHASRKPPKEYRARASKITPNSRSTHRRGGGTQLVGAGSGAITPGITRRPERLSVDDNHRVGGRVHAVVRLRLDDKRILLISILVTQSLLNKLSDLLFYGFSLFVNIIVNFKCELARI
jgi:hypothetical protein